MITNWCHGSMSLMCHPWHHQSFRCNGALPWMSFEINQPKLLTLPLFQHFITAIILVKTMLSTNIYPLCYVSHYLSLCSGTEGLPSLSAQTQNPLISGVAQSRSSLTTDETFSHVHIRLILNVQQHCFFVCWKMAPWMQPDLRDNPVVLRPLVDDYQVPKMADTPAKQPDPVWWTFRMDGPKE